MRSTWIVMMCTMFCWAAFAQNGVDLPGQNYSDFDAPTHHSCRDTCAGESNCQAYTWVRPGVKGAASGHCWLKSSVPAGVKDVCCISGSREFLTKADIKAEGEINRPGLDFKNFATDGWKECEAACTVNNVCKSWTYVRAQMGEHNGHCWLKSGVARPIPDPNMGSGVKFTDRSDPKYF